MAISSEPRKFDLNSETILEGWETCHAIRELIANALDEAALSRTQDIQISEDIGGAWHVRDFGRGLKYEHLTQNENQEKLQNATKVIGKFGVGLKDALATLNRRGVDVSIRSMYGDISLGLVPKYGFNDVVTLHALVHPPEDPALVGTDVILRRVSEEDIADAKRSFLKFSAESVLEETAYGQILSRSQGGSARIYVTGMLVAEEENFGFSYNITSLTATMRKALNRERTNVGRTAYSDRVKQMLLASKASRVADILVEDLVKLETGTNRDEVKWTDVAVHACQILNSLQKVIFVTASDLILYKDAIDHAQADGLRVVALPDNIKTALKGVTDLKGDAVRDVSVYRTEWEQSFEFTFVKPENLSKAERAVYGQWKAVADLVGGLPKKVNSVTISETMRPELFSSNEALGLWDPKSSSIVVKRTQLGSLLQFAATLLHEIGHARSGYTDITREYESELTQMLGEVTVAKLRS